MSEAAPRRLSAVPDTCTTCARLEAAGRKPDPAGAGAALANLISHRVTVHGATGKPQDDCPECQHKKATEDRSPLYAHWARTHYVMHELGIVNDTPYPRTHHDDPVYPLRFADTPRP